MKNRQTFYDSNPFNYGYFSKADIIARMNPNLKLVIQRNKGKSIYDIGCGCGRNLIYSLKFSDDVTGVDLSHESLKFSKDFVNSNRLRLIHGNNLSLPLDDQIADLVISDGVIHHTGDTVKAFKECLRILKPGGNLYLAVYKKWRYYPLLYKTLGYSFRILNKVDFGRIIIEHVFVKLHYLLYKIFKKQSLNLTETRNIFYDYFITPIASFQSKKQVVSWIQDENCNLEIYDKTTGNCHVFVIRKNA